MSTANPIGPKQMLGAVLGGGQSSRFGTPKALFPFMGEPLARRAAQTLGSVCGEVVLVTNLAGAGEALGLRAVGDTIPGSGPLGGLHAGLLLADRTGSDGVFVLACDMPLVGPELISLIAEAGRASGARAAVAVTGPRGIEPLCAWYAIECLDPVEKRIARGELSVIALAEAVNAHRVPARQLNSVCDPTRVFRSANTRSELADLERIAGSNPEVGVRTPSARRGDLEGSPHA
ncbi:MAG: molybdenum cofactor guanylyltransferase [Gemmatimonadota bacterium]